MKSITYLLVASLILFSCSNDVVPSPIKIKNDALIIGDPMDCGLDSLTIFPVGCSYNPDVIEPPKEVELHTNALGSIGNKKIYLSQNSSTVTMYDRAAEVEFVNENQESYDIRNLIFYNLLSGESYTLVNDSIHILSFAVHKEFEKSYIFYRVVREDYNEDDKFDTFDPVMLYISNLDGSGFTQITPETEYFIDYTVYSKTNSILIKTAIDSNKDLKFLVDDETNYRSMNLSEQKFAENIFNSSLKDTLRKYN